MKIPKTASSTRVGQLPRTVLRGRSLDRFVGCIVVPEFVIGSKTSVETTFYLSTMSYWRCSVEAVAKCDHSILIKPNGLRLNAEIDESLNQFYYSHKFSVKRIFEISNRHQEIELSSNLLFLGLSSVLLFREEDKNLLDKTFYIPHN